MGSKRKLLAWIERYIPRGTEAVLDAFSGSGVVSWHLKCRGYAVIANDRMRFCSHIARAVVENSLVTLSSDEVQMLLEPVRRKGPAQRWFRGLFFKRGVHEVIDSIRFNIERLSGYKRDLALAALGATCISGVATFGHFTSTVPRRGGRVPDTPKRFTERFATNCRRMNALVFVGRRRCRAWRLDVFEALGRAEVDVAYFDPPYSTRFSSANYEMRYHFVEGLMTMWENLTIDESKKTRLYRQLREPSMTPRQAEEMFERLFDSARHIRWWLISWSDTGVPSPRALARLAVRFGREVRVHRKRHTYHLGITPRGIAGVEVLLVCRRK